MGNRGRLVLNLKFSAIKNDIGRINFSTPFKNLVRTVIFKSHKILGTIIYSISINMMRGFSWFKGSVNLRFNDKTMFQNIVLLSFERMIRGIRKDISLISLWMATLPMNPILTSSSNSHFLFYFRSSFISTRFHDNNILLYRNYNCNIFKLLNINTLKEANYA